MKHLRYAAMLAVLLIVTGVTASPAGAVPEYTVQRTRSDITVDGRLDEPVWDLAADVGEFVFPWWTSGEKEQTTVKMLWNDTYLYIAYICDDAHVSGTVWNTNGPTFIDDTVEIFWNPDPAAPGWQGWYYMFEMNCFGNLQTVLRTPSTDPAERKITVLMPRIGHVIDGTLNKDSDRDNGWVLEVAIRFDDYDALLGGTAPQAGDLWRVGLNRCGGETNQQYSQWSPSGTDTPNFHVPDDFGRIIFSDIHVEDSVGVEDTSRPSDTIVTIDSVAPNPFNASTSIRFTLARDTGITAEIYDINGRHVRTLTSARFPAGSHSLTWHGTDNRNTLAASGVYFVRIAAAGTIDTAKLLYMK